MGDAIDAIVEEATRAGDAMLARGELAKAVSYEAGTRCLRVELHNGAVAEIPADLIEALAKASDADRGAVEVAGIGYGLHWPSLDLDLSVPGLLSDVFGTRRWMNRSRAAAAGTSSSPRKAAAARRNGAKGGRPRKFAD